MSNFDSLLETCYSSLPSKGVNHSDIPVPTDVGSEFQYNYFVSDETTSRESVVDGESITSFTTLTDDASEADRLQAMMDYNVPRFVKVSWSPTELDSLAGLTQSSATSAVWSGAGAGAVEQDMLEGNLENILYEETMTSNQYSGINFQDAEGLTKLTEMAKIAINTSELPFSFASTESSSVSSDSNLDVINSYLELAGASTGVDPAAKELLRTALGSYQSTGDMSFFNQAAEREAVVDDSFFNTSTKFDLGVSVSNVLAARCGHAWGQDGGSAFFEEISRISSTLSQITSAGISQDAAGAISDDDYDITGDPVTYRLSENIADQTQLEQYDARIVGYMVEKHEVDSNGTVIELEPILVSNPEAGDMIDPNVMYGRGYRYKVRTVAYVEFSAINVYPGNQSRDQTVVVGLLFASRPSKTTTVLCVERIPPKPPVDISFVFNPDTPSGGLDISWSFPINKQRDIKQFRIFRRLSPQLPFSLIKNYFFDDSTTLTKTTEIPDPDALVESSSSKLSNSTFQVVDGPHLLFTDLDFNFNSTYIYSIVSVDARGMSSNYSAQHVVSYDRFKGRINVTYLSKSGAPIPYPNLYLRQDLFPDTIRMSGYDRMHVYFDPEYLTVKDSNDNDLSLVSTSEEDPSYKISMINLDNQKSKLIDIYVKDIRDDPFQEEEGIEYSIRTTVRTLIDV